jgi:Ser/Thr protein kinase RdoA (MazF antagonist)
MEPKCVDRTYQQLGGLHALNVHREWSRAWSHPFVILDQLAATGLDNLQKAKVARIVSVFQDLVPKLRHGFIHGDISRKNILVTNNEMRLIDFEESAYAPIILDYAFAANRFCLLGENPRISLAVDMFRKYPALEGSTAHDMEAACMYAAAVNTVWAAYRMAMSPSEIELYRGRSELVWKLEPVLNGFVTALEQGPAAA